jgi:tetratricopeptide (TPR) repeat protein
MYNFFLFFTVALVGATMALIQPIAAAKSAFEIKDIARSVVLEIRLQKNGSAGSGVIVNKKGNLYTLVTNEHVVCGNQRCFELPAGETYTLSLPDGKQYRAKALSIKLLGNDLDLAIIQFRSNRKYSVAKISIPGSLKINDTVYAAGFPAAKPGFAFGDGKAIAVVNKRLTVDFGGYTIVHNAITLPGMSGGGIFNQSGELVAIHGRGEKFLPNTIKDISEELINTKLGYNRGIPIRWVVQSLDSAGIRLGQYAGQRLAPAMPNTADEHFIAGFNKFVEPGENVTLGKKQALQEFSKAINLKPDYISAYYFRGNTYGQLQKFSLGIHDLNRVIELQPSNLSAYLDRGLFQEKSGNFAVAIEDYNQGILINPHFPMGYIARGTLKAYKLNDFSGALADYNQAVKLGSVTNALYSSRGFVRSQLNDFSGSLADYNRALKLYPGDAYTYLGRANLHQIYLKNPEAALLDFDKAICLVSGDADLYQLRGALKQFNLLDFSGALDDYNQAIVIAPKDAKNYQRRAFLKGNRLKDFAGALADYQAAINLAPQLADAYLDQGIIKHESLNDFSGALADYNAAIKIDPYSVDSYTYRGLLRSEELDDIVGAFADYDHAIKVNPKWFRTYNFRGLLKAKKYQDWSGALADYNESIALNSKYGKAFFNRGMLKIYQLGDQTGGIKDLQQSAKLWRADKRIEFLPQVTEQLRRLGIISSVETSSF